jgi:hypothetical protein
MSLPEKIRLLLGKDTDVIAPIMPTLLDHIAWVSVEPSISQNPNSPWYNPDRNEPKYRVWRFELSRRMYTYYLHGGDGTANETATLKDYLPAYTEEEVEAILLSWTVELKNLRSGLASGYPRPGSG